MKTEAIVLCQIGSSSNAFELRPVEIPSLGSDEVLIESEAFGLNYADVMARHGLYKEAPPMPCVLGYEAVGTVKQVGSNVSSEWIGKRVLAFTRFGAYAKIVQTKVNAIVEIGDLSAEIAMALSTQGVTAYYMSDVIAPIRKNEHVLIHAAAGGVGSLLIQLAKLKGAIVYAKIGSEEKRAFVKECGADFVLNYKGANYESTLLNLLGSNKLSASFNPVAGDTIKKDAKLLGPNGRLYLFGGSQMVGGKFGIFSKLKFLWDMGIILPIGLMMQSKSLIGVNMLKIADSYPDIISTSLKEVVQLHQLKKITPHVGGVFTQHEIVAAHDLLESGKSMGKITVRWT
ncbi:MAG: quinone oxidoreductase family protein [Crocinitomicaceae bacterium]|jgi:NADPH2:quinone reductase